MNILTTSIRMWLTRSIKPFKFTNNYDKTLDYENEKNLGLYIHIPFCEKICSFCPYCKEKFTKTRCDRYIDYLIREIHYVGKKNKTEVTSLYFGGGTPALAIDRLEEIISTVSQYFIITQGIGIELHPRNVTKDILIRLKNMGISKISIGIQSFQDKFLNILGRDKIDYEKMFAVLKEVSFETLSMDFIFALPNQNIYDLKSDIDTAFKNGANHIAIYPFIDFSFTDIKIPKMSKKNKRNLLDSITLYCEEKGYKRDSIWTFSKDSTAKYSSMTRDNFLGFGASATTLLKKQFKINTFCVSEYEKRIENNDIPTSLTIKFTKRQRMVYYLFWTLYSTKMTKKDFEDFFGEKLEDNYGFEFFVAQKLKFLILENSTYSMTLKGAFYYHYYESFYTLAYIDKMWNIMRKEPFPKELKF